MNNICLLTLITLVKVYYKMESNTATAANATNLLKSENDKNIYDLFELPNKLTVLLVNDLNT